MLKMMDKSQNEYSYSIKQDSGYINIFKSNNGSYSHSFIASYYLYNRSSPMNMMIKNGIFCLD